MRSLWREEEEQITEASGNQHASLYGKGTETPPPFLTSPGWHTADLETYQAPL